MMDKIVVESSLDAFCSKLIEYTKAQLELKTDKTNVTSSADVEELLRQVE